MTTIEELTALIQHLNSTGDEIAQEQFARALSAFRDHVVRIERDMAARKKMRH